MATTNRDFRVKNGLVVEGASATVNGQDVVTTSASQTLTNKTLTSPSLSLSTTTSTSEGRIAWDATTDKIIVGDGSSTKEFSSSTISFNQQSGAYTLVLSDKDKMVEVSNASPVQVTIPLDSSVNFAIGSQIMILQTGSGQVTVDGTVGVTLNATPGKKLRAQWSSATLVKRAADSWVLIGDLTA